MRNLNLDELLERISDLSSDVEYADTTYYHTKLLQFWNFLITEPISNRVLQRIGNDYSDIGDAVFEAKRKDRELLQQLTTPYKQGAFGYFILKKHFSSENLDFRSEFRLVDNWYKNRRSYDESKEDFNSNFFNPFIKLLEWYLEENVSQNSNDYFSKKEVVHFEDKLDEIKEIVLTVKDGQEIIYDEIEDLKELLLSSKKKNWTEMFKGKFYDFVFNELITDKNFDDIFNILTGEERTAISSYIKALTS